MDEALPETYIFMQAFAAGQMLLAALLILFVKTPHLRAARLLAAFVALYGVTFIFNLAFHLGLIAPIPIVIPVYVLCYLLLGPAFYGYVQAIIQRQPGALFAAPLRHALPIIIAVALSFLWLAYDTQTRAALMDASFEPQSRRVIAITIGVLAVQIFMPIQSAFYLGLTVRALHRHSGSIKEYFSNTTNKSLRWAKWIALGLLFIWAMDFITSIFGPDGAAGLRQDIAFIGVELALIYAACIFGIRQTSVFANFGDDPPTPAATQGNVVSIQADTEAAPKYAKSSLDKDDLALLADRIDTAMTEQRLFENALLTLADLARHVRSNQNHVSQTLNQHLGYSFFDYVAMHRVEAAKSALSDPASQETVLDIAMNVGFNAKSTFNAAFKKHSGMTPSAFRRAQMEGEKRA